jgi:hypothetical protein
MSKPIQPTHSMTSFRMKCVGVCHRTFILDVERKEDLTMSHLSDTHDPNQNTGYAIYRDRSFVECPSCHGLCKMLPGSSTLDVSFKPSK